MLLLSIRKLTLTHTQMHGVNKTIIDFILCTFLFHTNTLNAISKSTSCINKMFPKMCAFEKLNVIFQLPYIL